MKNHILNEDQRLTVFLDALKEGQPRGFERVEFNRKQRMIDIYFTGGLVVTMTPHELWRWINVFTVIAGQIKPDEFSDLR